MGKFVCGSEIGAVNQRHEERCVLSLSMKFYELY